MPETGKFKKQDEDYASNGGMLPVYPSVTLLGYNRKLVMI